jgi:hypothetical protein
LPDGRDEKTTSAKNQLQRRAFRGGLEVSPYGIRAGQVGAMIGSEKLAQDMIAAGWIKPIVKQPHLTLYSAAHVAKAFSRLVDGELPPDSNAKYAVARRKAARLKKAAEQAAKDALE